MRAIADDAERIAAAGERSAEQAAMSLETLLGTLAQNKEVDQAAARAALDRLVQQLPLRAVQRTHLKQNVQPDQRH